MKKGILERLLYMAIGATFTLLIVLLVDSKNWKKDNIDVAKVETIEETVVNETVEEKLVTVEPHLDFEEEAEEKLKELKEKQQVSETETQTEEIKESVSANSIEAAKVKWIKDYPTINSEKTLEEKQNERSSYEETLATNAFDKKVIENSKIDFSDVKIAILGDSITEASNLSDEDKAKYSYPVKLQEILGCKEVYNLGIGGSTISRVGGKSMSMVERKFDFPKDADIIIVFGGSNDCLFENKWEYGELEYEHRMHEDTFCGDLDDMCWGIRYEYREQNEDSYVKMLFVNPPSTILNDGVYAIDPGNMVKQEEFAKAINQIAQEYDFEVIDLFNNNLFNSHDKDVNANWITDGIHPNAEGYQMIAEHLASQIIQRIEQ